MMVNIVMIMVMMAFLIMLIIGNDSHGIVMVNIVMMVMISLTMPQS